MPSAKSGTAGTPVAPAEPTVASDADDAEPGAVESTKAAQRATQTGKYGAIQTTPFKPPAADPSPASSTPATSTTSDTTPATDDPAPPKHWIEIVVTDEKGNPMPGESYNLLLPDGTTSAGTLDEKGFIRIDGIPAGSCTFSLPNRQDDEWHA